MRSIFKLSVLVSAIDKLSRPVRIMKRAGMGLNNFFKRARGAAQWGRNVAAAGAMVAASAIAVNAALVAPLVTSAKFSAAMSGVGAVSQATASEMADLTTTAKELGATTSFSATQAAGGMQFLGQAGFKTNEIIAAMPGTLALARAGAMDLASAADISSNILSGFGLEAGKMTETADLLAATFTGSNTNLRLLGETMKFVAPLARAAGVDMKTASAMAGLLGKAGIQGSMAGTSLSAVLSRLSAPVGRASEALGELGVSAVDEAGNVRNIVDVLTELSGAVGDIPSGKKLGFIKDIFGEEATKSALTLIDQAGTGELLKFVNQLDNVGGTAKRVADQMNDNLLGDVTTFKSALESLFITIGERLEPVIRPLVQSITSAVRGMAAWAEEHPRLTSAIMLTLGAVGGLLAIAAPLMLLAGGMAAGFGFMATGVTAAGDALSFLKLTATSFGSKAAAGLLPYGTTLARLITMQGLFEAKVARGGWGQLVQFQAFKAQLSLQSLVASGKAWMVTNARMAAGAILALPARIMAATVALKGNTLAMASNARQSLFTVAGWRAMGSGVLATAAKGLKSVGLAIRGIGVAIAANPIGLIVTAIALAALIIYKFWAPISGFFKGLFGGIWEALSPLHGAFEAIGDAVGFILTPVGWLIDAIGGLLTPVEDVGGAAEGMGRSIGKTIGNIVMWFLMLPVKIISVGIDMVKAILGGLVAGWTALTGWVTSAIDGVKALFSDGFIDGILNIFLLFNPALWILNGLNALTETLFGFNLFDAGSKIIDSLLDGILSAAAKPIAAVKGIIESVSSLWPFGDDAPDIAAATSTASVRALKAAKNAAIGAAISGAVLAPPVAANAPAIAPRPVQKIAALKPAAVKAIATVPRPLAPPVAKAQTILPRTAPRLPDGLRTRPVQQAAILKPAAVKAVAAVPRPLVPPVVKTQTILPRTAPRLPDGLRTRPVQQVAILKPAAVKTATTVARPLVPPVVKTQTILPRTAPRLPDGLRTRPVQPTAVLKPAAVKAVAAVPRPLAPPAVKAQTILPRTAPRLPDGLRTRPVQQAAILRSATIAAKPVAVKTAATVARPFTPPVVKAQTILPPPARLPVFKAPKAFQLPPIAKPAPLPTAGTANSSAAPVSVTVTFAPTIELKIEGKADAAEDIEDQVMKVLREQSSELADIITRAIERAKIGDFD